MAVRIHVLLARITGSARSFVTAMGAAALATQKLARTWKKAGVAISRSAKRIGLAASFIAFKAVKTFANFEDVMFRVGSLTRTLATRDFPRLTQAAREMGRTTQFTAVQAAKGMEQLALLGLSTTEIMEALPHVLQLAAVGGVEMSKAAQIASSNLRAFNLEAGLMGQVNDTLTAAFTSSLTNLEQLAEALRPVAPIASTVNVSLAETAALLATVADSSFRGSVGGIALRRAFLNLAAPTKAMRDAMEQFGINALDPTLVKLEKVQRALEATANEQEKLAIATAVFGHRAAAAMIKILEKGIPLIRKTADEFERLRGITEDMQKERLKSLTGQFLLLVSAVTDLFIAMGEELSPILQLVMNDMRAFLSTNRDDIVRNMTQALIGFVNIIHVLSQSLIENKEEIIQLWNSFTKFLGVILKFIAERPKLAATLALLGAAHLFGLIGAITALGKAITVTLIAAFRGLVTFISATLLPAIASAQAALVALGVSAVAAWAAVTFGVALLVVGLIALMKKVDETQDKFQKLEEAAVFLGLIASKEDRAKAKKELEIQEKRQKELAVQEKKIRDKEKPEVRQFREKMRKERERKFQKDVAEGNKAIKDEEDGGIRHLERRILKLRKGGDDENVRLKLEEDLVRRRKRQAAGPQDEESRRQEIRKQLDEGKTLQEVMLHAEETSQGKRAAQQKVLDDAIRKAQKREREDEERLEKWKWQLHEDDRVAEAEARQKEADAAFAPDVPPGGGGQGAPDVPPGGGGQGAPDVPPFGPGFNFENQQEQKERERQEKARAREVADRAEDEKGSRGAITEFMDELAAAQVSLKLTAETTETFSTAASNLHRNFLNGRISIDTFNEGMEKLKGIQDVAEKVGEFKNKIDELQLSTGLVALHASLFKLEVDKLWEKFNKGEIGAAEFEAGLDRVNIAMRAAATAADLEAKAELQRMKLRFLQGKDTATDRRKFEEMRQEAQMKQFNQGVNTAFNNLLNFGDAAGKATESFSGLSRGMDKFGSRMRNIGGQGVQRVADAGRMLAKAWGNKNFQIANMKNQIEMQKQVLGFVKTARRRLEVSRTIQNMQVQLANLMATPPPAFTASRAGMHGFVDPGLSGRQNREEGRSSQVNFSFEGPVGPQMASEIIDLVETEQQRRGVRI